MKLKPNNAKVTKKLRLDRTWGKSTTLLLTKHNYRLLLITYCFDHRSVPINPHQGSFFSWWTGNNTKIHSWTICRVRDFEVLNPKCDVFIKLLPSKLWDLWERNGKKILWTRGNWWLWGSSSFQTQWNWCIYKLTESVVAYTRPAQVHIWGLSTEMVKKA